MEENTTQLGDEKGRTALSQPPIDLCCRIWAKEGVCMEKAREMERMTALFLWKRSKGKECVYICQQRERETRTTTTRTTKMKVQASKNGTLAFRVWAGMRPITRTKVSSLNKYEEVIRISKLHFQGM